MCVTEFGGLRRNKPFGGYTLQDDLRSLNARRNSVGFRDFRTRIWIFQRSLHSFVLILCVLAVGVFTTSVRVNGEDHLETLHNASAASSSSLRSGSGTGMLRLYEAIGEGEWKLKFDSEINTHFVGKIYYIELIFNPEFRGLKCRRILKDERSMRTAEFSPGWRTGAPAREVKPTNYGDGLARPPFDDIAWDVSRLSENVWNVDQLIRRLPQQKINIVETAVGDLVGSYSRDAQGRFPMRFECPRRFGFNIGTLQSFDPGNERATYEIRVEWKQAETGLWYVRSLQEDWRINDEKKRMRRVLKYTDFKPNVNIEPRVFTTEFLRRPMGTERFGSRVDVRTNEGK